MLHARVNLDDCFFHTKKLVDMSIISKECHVFAWPYAFFYSICSSCLSETNLVDLWTFFRTTSVIETMLSTCFIFPVARCNAGWVGNVYSTYCLRQPPSNGTYAKAQTTCQLETGQPSSVVKPYLPEIYVMMKNMDMEEPGKYHAYTVSICEASITTANQYGG